MPAVPGSTRFGDAMKFLTTVVLDTYGECVVEAPSLEAAEAWMAEQKSDGFRDWFLDQNDAAFSTTVSLQDEGAVDIYINEDGKEIPRPVTP